MESQFYRLFQLWLLQVVRAQWAGLFSEKGLTLGSLLFCDSSLVKTSSAQLEILGFGFTGIIVP